MDHETAAPFGECRCHGVGYGALGLPCIITDLVGMIAEALCTSGCDLANDADCRRAIQEKRLGNMAFNAALYERYTKPAIVLARELRTRRTTGD